MACSTIKSGTKEYMSLYPKDSTDGGLRLGNTVPDFSAQTTFGPMSSFHEWKKGKWAVLFSHPADFTPVCTTEIASLAKEHQKFKDMDCLIATLSVDSLETHQIWMKDIIAHDEDGLTSVDFPIMADHNRDIAGVYGMVDPYSAERAEIALTIRCVFIINPENKLMLSLNYPACVGRNTAEIVRCVQALQLSYQKSIATPVNWPNNHAKVTLKDGTVTNEYKGAVFLLPSVTDQDAKAHYPDFYTCEVPSKEPYLRLVKAKDVGYLPKTKNTSSNKLQHCKSKPTATAENNTKNHSRTEKKGWFRRLEKATKKVVSVSAS